MKLLRVHIISARACGGLLDNFNCTFRSNDIDFTSFDPLCLIGPNGAGKSQLMQVVAEIFQSACRAVVPEEERLETNSENLFEIEYLIRPNVNAAPAHVQISRKIVGKRKTSPLTIRRRTTEGWIDCDLTDKATAELLPKRVVGYTSGENETLSLPFLMSRSGYAAEVRDAALNDDTKSASIPDTRLMLIDYGTNLEVLVANLVFGGKQQRNSLLAKVRVDRLHSCRCIVQLNHSAVSSEVQLTDELSSYLEKLEKCSTTHTFDKKTKTHIFDFWVNDATRKAFRLHWESALDLYRAFHKFAMLNDLAIKKKTRDRVRKENRNRYFATRLPEPADDDKVFRFEQVKFISSIDGSVVDYVSLSDGEHQLCQLLGMMIMQKSSGVLFLLDEPESHFNPQWRIEFIKSVMSIPTISGKRGQPPCDAAEQDFLLTTHAPFVPSDMPRERVFMFAKDEGNARAHNPDIETYGATFDTIIEECFGVIPPISQLSRDEIGKLMQSDDRYELERAIKRLGHSVQKALLIERLMQLRTEAGE